MTITPLLPIPESYWIVPGKLLAGEYPGSFFIEETRRRVDDFLTARFDTFIDLTCPGERESYVPVLLEQASYFDMHVRHLRFPIGDFGLPTPEGMRTTLNAIDAALEAGGKVYVHCWGGIGRTGTTVGCYLVRHGRSGPQALTQLAEWWQRVPKSALFKHSPETKEQEDFILNWKES